MSTFKNRPGEDPLMRQYRYHACFAAAYAEQQMLDREAGRVLAAVFCQSRAHAHATLAMSIRKNFAKEPA
jgi:hypothetical protein